MKCRKRIKRLVSKCKKSKILPSLDEILKHTELLLKESQCNRDALRKTLNEVEHIDDLVE